MRCCASASHINAYRAGSSITRMGVDIFNPRGGAISPSRVAPPWRVIAVARITANMGPILARMTVGAVYDRAIFASEWEEYAVIDRAYSEQFYFAAFNPWV